MNKGCLLLFIIFIFAHPCGHAQGTMENASLPSFSDYIVQQYTSDNGLPQNTAVELTLDKNNFLWIATQNGLVRFDGRRFRLYNMGNTPILNSNRIRNISKNEISELFITTSFNDSVIYRITPDYRLIIDSAVTTLAHKLVNYHSNGIFDFSPLIQYYAKKAFGSIDSSLLLSLCASPDNWMVNTNELFIRLGSGLYYLNNKYPQVIKLSANILSSHLHAFLIGDIFCFRDDGGMMHYYKKGIPFPIRVEKRTEQLLKAYDSLPEPRFSIADNGSVTFLKRRNDIYRLFITDSILNSELLFDNLPIPEDLSSWSYQFDEEANRLFIGTLNAGLFVITKRAFHTLQFSSKDSRNNSFMALQTLPKGRLLTSNGILDLKNSARNEVFSNKDRPDRYCIFKDADRSILLSRDHHLWRYDSNFMNGHLVDTLVLNTYISSIIQPKKTKLWLSTASSLLTLENGELHYVLRNSAILRNRIIETIAEISPDELWIATRKGIFSYNIPKNELSAEPVIPDVYARTLVKDHKGYIWIGTYGNGYFRYKDNDFVSLPLDPDKYLLTAHCFLEDSSGFFWVGTNHGLFRILKKELEDYGKNGHEHVLLYYVDKSSGFNTNEFNGGSNPAGLREWDSFFYMPSLNGVVYFKSDETAFDRLDRPLFVDNLMVDSIEIDSKSAFKIRPDFNQLVIRISTPFYGLDENMQVQYSLGNSDSKWYFANSDGKIVFNRLPGGKYNLLVRKVNGYGKNDYTYVNISFEVLPHWYNTTLFYCILAGAILFMGILALKLRTKLLLKQNVRLQNKVNERTFELKKSTFIKERLMSIVMHDLRTPLFSQALLMEYLYENYGDLSPEKMEELLLDVKNSTKKLNQFSHEFLMWYNSNQDGFVQKRELLDLKEFIGSICSFYSDIVLRKGLFLTSEIGEGILLFSDKDILATILHNVIDNAVKYTKIGGIIITVSEQNSLIRIDVRDTGPGISAEKLPRLTSNRPSSGEILPSGFGYWFIQDFIGKLGGVLTIESGEDVGTTVTLSFRQA